MIKNKFIRLYMMDRAESRKEYYANHLSEVMSDPNEVFGGMWSAEISNFESNMQKLTRYKYAVATNSGTSAMFMFIDWFIFNCGIKNIKPIFFIPAHTFTSVYTKLVSLAVKNEIEIVLYEVDQITHIASEVKDLDVSKIKEQGICIIPVNINNHYVDTKALVKQFRNAGLDPYVLHDAAQSLGAINEDESSVLTTHGDIKISTIVSFSIGKMISSGEGGMLLTNDDSLYIAARKAAFYGVTKEVMIDDLSGEKQFYASHQYVLDVNSNIDGRKSSYSGIQAAVANSQLHFVNDIRDERLGVAKKLFTYFGNEDNKRLLNGNCITYPFILPESVDHFRAVRLQSNLFSVGVGSQLGLRNVTEQSMLVNNEIINSVEYLKKHYTPTFTNFEECINRVTRASPEYKLIHLPCHTMLSDDDIEDIARRVNLTLKRL